MRSISTGTFPKYVENRMHILFHLAGVTFHHPDVLQEFLRKYAKKLGGLTSSLLKDICNRSILSHPHLMVLFGVTDPWMTLFYQEKYSNLELVPHLKSSVEFLESLTRDPSHLLHTVTDCFGQILDEQDPVLTSLKASPLNAGSTGRVAQVALLVLQCQLHDSAFPRCPRFRGNVDEPAGSHSSTPGMLTKCGVERLLSRVCQRESRRRKWSQRPSSSNTPSETVKRSSFSVPTLLFVVYYIMKLFWK
ncbi:hypothetical protein CAPTEDRAFT_218146 [Capitella teleta]|uniref:Uncharacterized protein n=1 Tax=Capitella teleta TaxID=283909 RepID=R7V1T9_CAPTE|nr:hypothetical protein CAPTEDRAFT_218146 [Capitella teleta]|eukprot:ELU12467.1 hypothetical protein CAPTEDRAFT_218146 [Capitella teleta]